MAFWSISEARGSIAGAITSESQEPKRRLGDDRPDAARELERLRAELAALKAQLQGSGAIAQSGGVAAGAGGTAVGRDYVTNNYVQPAPGADASTLRSAYLHRLATQTESLALSGIDPALAQDREARLKETPRRLRTRKLIG